MIDQANIQKYLEALLSGDRRQCRTVIEDILHRNSASIIGLYSEVIWPIMVEVDKLYRADAITSVQEHLASRINRTIVDQLQNKLPRKEQLDKKVVICCAPSESSELGAQIIADMFESVGWSVRFVGGGMSNDEILSFTSDFGPDCLVIYGTQGSQAPEVRAIIDRIHDVDTNPDMKIMLSGGVFARAEGLWEEIGADMYAETPERAIELASKNSEDLPVPTRTINKRKRGQKKETAKAS